MVRGTADRVPKIAHIWRSCRTAVSAVKCENVNVWLWPYCI